MSKLTVRKLGPTFGVEISGLRPQTPLDAETASRLISLFDEHCLLVFRNIDADVKFQSYLSDMLIGADKSRPSKNPLKEFYVSNKEPEGVAPFGRLLYHSDMMWSPVDRTDLISLYGKEVEQPAVPTLFISAADGWDTLPEDLRSQVKGRFAKQCYEADTFKHRAAGDPDVLISTLALGDDYSAKTPIALPHPRTGRTILWVCQQTTQEIVGMPRDEGDALLDALFDHLYRPGKEVQHDWRQGDLVLWDNVALQHARPNVATKGPLRTLRKTIAPEPRMPAGFKPPNYFQAAQAS